MRSACLKGKGPPSSSSTWWDTSHAWTTEEVPTLATGGGLAKHALHFPHIPGQESIKGLHRDGERQPPHLQPKQTVLDQIHSCCSTTSLNILPNIFFFLTASMWLIISFIHDTVWMIVLQYYITLLNMFNFCMTNMFQSCFPLSIGERKAALDTL